MNGARGPDRLERRLGLGDAVTLGMASMIGAGIFAALGPAADVGGPGLLIGLAVAALVAFCNATSSAQLAAVYPEAGGTYAYARERLGPFWGYLAGWGFVVGKTASLAAMALTFGTYATPELARPLAMLTVTAMTMVNYRGIEKTAFLTRFVVTVVLISLAGVVTACLLGGQAAPEHLSEVGDAGAKGILQAGGLMFFAFAGYARIATLGEEVVDPERTIPRAIILSLILVLITYALVAGAALLAIGADRLARSPTPLATATAAGSLRVLVPLVRIGAIVASAGVLLSLLAGVSRTVFAMARNHELPPSLSAVHPRYRTPYRAELAIAIVVVIVVMLADLRNTIGFSSFTVLAYYALTNASAWSQPFEERRWPRAVQTIGAMGCLVLAFTLPLSSVIVGAAVLSGGAILRLVRRRGGAIEG